MPKIRKERLTAEVTGDFVVFLIGMRINAFWKLHKWIPVFMAMPRMLKELSEDDNSGLLCFRNRWAGRNFEVIQYWESFEKLRDYAHNKNAEHLPAWADFNKKVADDGSVGIWHETYLVQNDQFETVYQNMPLHGLGRAMGVVPAKGRRKTAKGRLGASRKEEDAG